MPGAGVLRQCDPAAKPGRCQGAQGLVPARDCPLPRFGRPLAHPTTAADGGGLPPDPALGRQCRRRPRLQHLRHGPSARVAVARTQTGTKRPRVVVAVVVKEKLCGNGEGVGGKRACRGRSRRGAAIRLRARFGRVPAFGQVVRRVERVARRFAGEKTTSRRHGSGSRSDRSSPSPACSWASVF